MSTDSLIPSLYRVSIDATGLGGAAPQDGFIDPVTVQKYRQQVVKLGTVVAPLVVNGNDILINSVGIEFVTGALDLTGIINTINALRDRHHVIARIGVGGELELTNDPTYEGKAIRVQEGNVGGVLASIGFEEPIVSVLDTQISTIDASLAKERANMRWQMIVEKLSEMASMKTASSFDMPAADVETEASSIDFSIAFYLDSHIRTRDENNTNVILYNTIAIKRVIARAMVIERTSNRDTINPAPQVGIDVRTVTCGQLAADIATAEAAITVTPISNLG